MATITTTITEYESRSAGDGVIHKFKTADGKTFQTWKQDIADDVKTYLNQGPVTLDYEPKESNRNGRVYTDNYVNGVTGGADEGNHTPPQPGEQTYAVTSDADTRLNALDIVIELVGVDEANSDLGKAIELANVLVDWAQSGESPFSD